MFIVSSLISRNEEAITMCCKIYGLVVVPTGLFLSQCQWSLCSQQQEATGACYFPSRWEIWCWAPQTWLRSRSSNGSPGQTQPADHQACLWWWGRSKVKPQSQLMGVDQAWWWYPESDTTQWTPDKSVMIIQAQGQIRKQGHSCGWAGDQHFYNAAQAMAGGAKPLSWR